MKKAIFGTIITIGFVIFGTVASHAQTVSGALGPVKRGGATRGTVTLAIPGGLHVNSSRPNSKYAIPTNVKVTADAGVKISAVSYPRGTNRKFQFSEDTLNVYEGRTVFSFNVTVPATFRGNSVRVRVVVRYQACTDEVCYPPATKEITLTAPVK